MCGKSFSLEARGANFLLLENEGFEDEAEFGDFAAVPAARGAEDFVAEAEVDLLF